MNAKTLARNHILARHIAFGAHLHPNRQALVIDRLYHAADDFPQLFFKECQLHLAFGIANALLNHLPGCLGGDTAEIAWGGFHHDHAAKFSLWIDPARIGKCYFRPFILDRIQPLLFLQG